MAIDQGNGTMYFIVARYTGDYEVCYLITDAIFMHMNQCMYVDVCLLLATLGLELRFEQPQFPIT
jgi:hypothetical protein